MKSEKCNIEIEMIKFYEYEFEIKCVKFITIKINIIKN